MSVRTASEVWVGAERRADGTGHVSWFPAGYVTMTPKDGDEVRLTPDAARTVAKRLKALADVLDPPTPRKKRT